MPFAQLSDKKLFYTWRPAKVGSKQAGTTILFIHGLGSSSSFYETVIPSLVEAGFGCLALDTHGSGLSKLTTRQQDPVSIARDAEQLLSTMAIDVRHTIVVGHSMGCMVASEMASHGSYAGVVLIGAINPGPKYRDAFEKRIMTVTANGMEPMADTIPTMATGSRSVSVHHAFIRALLLSQNPEGYVSLCNAIISATQPDYSAIKCPVLVVSGEEDKTASLDDSKEIITRLGTDPKRVQLEILKGVGHWHCIEAADEVAALLAKFEGDLP